MSRKVKKSQAQIDSPEKTVKAEESKASKKPKNFIHYIAYFATAVVALVIVLMAAIAYIMLQPLPDISTQAIERRSTAPSTVFASDGSVLAQWRGDTERQPMQTDEFPQVILDATVAIEDQRFFDHSGLDLRGIMRAVSRNTQAGEVVEGGSTITQQLMKMMYAGEDQSVIRKVEEAILASRVEMERDKYDILAAYLNMAFFGQGAYGLAAASEAFFGVDPADLTIAQAATLAGVLHMPSAYRPHDDIAPLENRRNTVLAAMRDQGLITQAEFVEARATELEIQPRTARSSELRYPFFVDLVQRELSNYLDEERIAQGGLHIYTTLDPAVQQAAEESVATWNSDPGGPTASLVTMRHSDGAILALVGGKDWDEKQFNVAVQARRQPGSAFKPLTLIAALEEGIASDQLFDAAPFEVLVKDEMWNVTNYGGGQPADRMNLRASTVASVNTVYARLIIEVGPEKVVDLAHEMGFTADMEPDPALSLGGLRYGVSPLEMAHAYTTMARAGSDIEPRTITRITTASAVDVVVEESDYDAESIAVTNAPPDEVGDESSVQVLYQAPEFPEERRIYSEETGNEVASILRESVTSGTGRRANISGIDVSGKTGTTQNYHDAWFVGWAEGVTTAVWMGFPEAQIEMRDIRGRNVSGGSYPAQIFHDFMIAALEERPSYGLYYVAREPGGLWIPEFDDDDFAGSIFGDIPTLEEIGQAP